MPGATQSLACQSWHSNPSNIFLPLQLKQHILVVKGNQSTPEQTRSPTAGSVWRRRWQRGPRGLAVIPRLSWQMSQHPVLVLLCRAVGTGLGGWARAPPEGLERGRPEEAVGLSRVINTHDVVFIIFTIYECKIQWRYIHSKCCISISTVYPETFSSRQT